MQESVKGLQEAAATLQAAYKDRGDKLKAGPVWDFDWGTFVPGVRSNWIDHRTKYFA